MGVSFSKAQPPLGSKTLTDVVEVPALLDKMSMTDLRHLACVSRACRDATDDQRYPFTDGQRDQVSRRPEVAAQ